MKSFDFFSPEVNTTVGGVNGRITAGIKKVAILLGRRTGEVLVRMEPLSKGGAHFIAMDDAVIYEGPL